MTASDGFGTARAELRVHIRHVLSDGGWHSAYELVAGTCYRPSESTAILRLMLRDGTVEATLSLKVNGFRRTLYRLKGAKA